jgi:hypothetical protein
LLFISVNKLPVRRGEGLISPEAVASAHLQGDGVQWLLFNHNFDGDWLSNKWCYFKRSGQAGVGTGLPDHSVDIKKWQHPRIEAGDCNLRVKRGGSTASGPEQLRLSFRTASNPVERDEFVGFRLVREF